MSVQRIHANELGKLLNSANQPIYVLDDDLTIVFLNRACREWLGAAAEGLLGLSCAYHSIPTVSGPKSVAAGLCPPPQALSGGVSSATVFRLAEDGTLVERQAHFLPLGAGGEDVLGLVVFLDAGDETEKGDSPHLCEAPSGPFRQMGTVPSFRVGQRHDAETSQSEPIALHEEVRRFRQEAAARFRADRLIGQGPAMRMARRQVALAVASQSSVLLVGPPGSGRQHLAAAIHYGRVEREKGDSPHAGSAAVSAASSGQDARAPDQMGTVLLFRPTGAMIPLDCSLLGVDLLEAIAATIARGTARNEDALSGTLLLHRVDELPADVQVQLADFFTRRPPAWRLIATAAAPLGELARRGAFRADLAALLSTITIELPPLAQRRDDLPLLAQLFLEECNAAGARQIGGFSPAALDELDAYPWPGNLDELAQVVADAHQRAGGPEIGPADLPERLRLAAQAAAQPRRVEETIVLDEYLGRVERELIRRALARAKGNKTRAARLLGVTRPRLYRRMVQLGLE